MRRPEALGAGHTRARGGILEDAFHRIAVLKANARRLSVQIADAGTAAASGNGAVIGSVGIGTSSDAGQHPAQLGRFMHRIGAYAQARLRVYISLVGRRTVQVEA